MKTHSNFKLLARVLMACGLFLAAACPLSAEPIPDELEAWSPERVIVKLEPLTAEE